MRYLLSIHDVWPGNFPLVESHWLKLRSLGLGSAALMVVPEYHGSRPIAAEREFLAWLAEKQTSGAEIFLHGFRHLMAERVPGAALRTRRGAWGRWVNRALVGDEAEFCGLARADRDALLASGADAFRAAGLPLLGFVAPTWHGSPPRAGLAARGFRFWETRLRLHDLASGASRFAPPMAWKPGPAGARAFGGSAWLRAAARLPLVKVVLHPGDLDSPGVASALERVARAGSASSYASALPGTSA